MTTTSAVREHAPQPWLAVATLTLAWVLMGLSCLALGLLFFSGGYWDPNDNTSAFYREEVIRHRETLQAVLMMPLVSVSVAILAWLASFAAGARVKGALWAGSLSVLVGVLMVCVGSSNIEVASRYSQMGW